MKEIVHEQYTSSNGRLKNDNERKFFYYRINNDVGGTGIFH